MNISLLVKVIPKDIESGLYFSIQQFIASAKNRDCDFGVFDYAQCCVSLVGKPRILVDNQEKNIDDVNNAIIKMMVKHGINNVRGGSYVTINLNNNTLKILNKEYYTVNNCCFKCGQKRTTWHFRNFKNR